MGVIHGHPCPRNTFKRVQVVLIEFINNGLVLTIESRLRG